MPPLPAGSSVLEGVPVCQYRSNRTGYALPASFMPVRRAKYRQKINHRAVDNEPGDCPRMEELEWRKMKRRASALKLALEIR